MRNRVCRECGKTFYGANNATRCPACRERRANKRYPPSEVDDLMLDAREADAAGPSYGNWRANQLMDKQKLRQQAEENRRRKAADAGKEEQP